MSWETVDEGWGRAAAEFATMSEPHNSREYVAVHQQLGIGSGDRVLDVACGSGFALELAAARGATCAGIDASARLIDVARDRNPDADLRVGDMNELPWGDAEFDAATSFRGIWGTTPAALDEVHRVLRPGGRVAFTCWGDVMGSTGGWMLAPLLWAAEDELAHQLEMISPGQPGVGEALLADHGFEPGERTTVPFFWEFPDPAAYARTIASTGPAFLAIQEIGLDEFLARAEDLAAPFVREGRPIRGEVDVLAFVGTRRP